MKVVKLHEWTPKPSLSPTLNQKNSPIRPQKVKNDQISELKETSIKNDPKIKSNSNVRIQGIIENESC